MNPSSPPSPAPRPGRIRVAVVGHVEFVDFIAVPHLPAAGELVHAETSFARAAGGGGVASAVLAELGAEVDFFCALGDDDLGARAAAELTERGVRVHAAWRAQPTRRAVTLLEPAGERTIVTIGERLEPRGDDDLEWERLHGADGAFVTAGDVAALVRARAARVLVASPRARATRHGPALDALVFSAHDRDEAAWAAEAGDRARLLVATDNGRGGSWTGESEGTWAPVEPPGAIVDSFGCGDTFVAALTFGLASGMTIADAAGLGAQWGARALTYAGAPSPLGQREPGSEPPPDPAG
jgi:ribokinase